MKMSDDLAAAFNDQVTLEFASSLSYLQMSAFFEEENLLGMASWMRTQADEERQHALRFFDFIADRGNSISIGAVAAPRHDYDTAEDVFAASLEQERTVTRAIHDLYRLAEKEGDLSAYPLLQFFINEQNEEEASVETILERVRLAQGDPSALLMLDRELGARPNAPAEA